MLETLFTQVKHDLLASDEETLNYVIGLGLTYLVERKESLIAIWNQGNQEISYNTVRGFTNRVLGYLVRKKCYTIKERAYFEIITNYVSAANFNALSSWIEGEMSVPVDKMASLLACTVSPKIFKHIESCAE